MSRKKVALQRRAVALEALERKGLAEALLEREKAIFKRVLDGCHWSWELGAGAWR